MMNLAVEGKIVIFKVLAISKLVYLALPTVVPNNFIDEIARKKRVFTWDDPTFKIKHETLRTDFKAGEGGWG